MTTVSLLRPRQHPVGRHPERTRDRILASALREFSDKGFAGARVDRIARRARINKRMLYHYFGNKAHLFREILARKVREGSAWAGAAGARDAPRRRRSGAPPARDGRADDVSGGLPAFHPPADRAQADGPRLRDAARRLPPAAGRRLATRAAAPARRGPAL